MLPQTLSLRLREIMKYKIGDRVVLAKIPEWVQTLPAESRLAFKVCLYKAYSIVEIDPNGLLVLDVSSDVDPVLGSKFNDIRVESKYVTPPRSPKRARAQKRKS